MKTDERVATQPSTWLAIVTAAALVATVSLAATAVVLGDLEAAAVTVATAVALVLLRFRTGLLGVLGLGVSFANLAVWNVPGAISNITHAEGLLGSMLPTVLALTSLVGLVGVGACLLARRTQRSLRGERLVVGAATGLAIVALVLAVVSPFDAVTPLATDLVLAAEDTKFSSTTLEATSGEVGVFVSNRDLFWHTFTVPELGVNLNVPVSAGRRLDFHASPGSYEFVCAIPGHAQAGMKGTLLIR